MNKKSTTYYSDIIYNFSDLYDQRRFTDCTIVIQEPPATIYAHRAVLANWSSFFMNGFTSGMQEAAEQKIELTFNPCNKVPEMINYMYTEYINITAENLMPLIEISNYYDVASLYQGLVSKLNEIITVENVIPFVQQCYDEKLNHALLIISKQVSRYYDDLDRKEFTQILDIVTFCSILKEAVLMYGFSGDLTAEILNYMNNEQPTTTEQADALNDLSNTFASVNLTWIATSA